MWLQELLADMEMKQQELTVVYEDNQCCIKLSMTERCNARTRHMDAKYHLLQDQQEHGVLDLQYCPIEEMIAHMLTKPLC